VTASPAGNDGQIQYNDGGTTQGTANFYWDDINGRVGIGTGSPDYDLDVAGNIGLDQYIYHNGDANTFIDFQDDLIDIQVGEKQMIKLIQSGTNKIVLNNGQADVDLQVKSKGNANVLRTDAYNNSVYFGSNGSAGVDNNFWVSGSIGSKDSATDRGTAVFGGDAVVSGSIVINNSLSSPPDTTSYTTFDVKGGVSGVSLIRGSSALSNNEHKVMILYGGSTQTPDSNMFSDMNFFVSGTIGSKDSDPPVKGTAVFGGDVVISGSLYTKQPHITSHKYSSGNSNQQYVKFDTTGAQQTPGVNNKFVVPAAGRVISVTMRSTTAAGNTDIAFHKASDGTASVNTTPSETIGINIASANTAYKVSFGSPSQFAAGDIVCISVNPTNPPNDVNLTVVWVFDFVN
jgi:hypothetical protein